MNDHMKTHVRDSFERLNCSALELTTGFYKVLFDLAPETRHMFPEDMSQQAVKLMQTLALAVDSLDKLEALQTPLRELGAKHVTFDVTEAHYGIVAVAMIKTLSMHVRDWSPGDHAAWAKLLGLLADEMITGARAALTKTSAA